MKLICPYVSHEEAREHLGLRGNIQFTAVFELGYAHIRHAPGLLDGRLWQLYGKQVLVHRDRFTTDLSALSSTRVKKFHDVRIFSDLEQLLVDVQRGAET